MSEGIFIWVQDTQKMPWPLAIGRLQQLHNDAHERFGISCDPHHMIAYIENRQLADRFTDSLRLLQVAFQVSYRRPPIPFCQLNVFEPVNEILEGLRQRYRAYF